MKRARRFSRSSNRWTSLVVCLALVLSLLVISQPIGTSISFAQGNQQPRNDKARRLHPTRHGRERRRLLYRIWMKKERPQSDPEVPLPIPSAIRSKRKPLESRKGKRVGNPGTTGTPGIGVTPLRTESVSERTETASRSRPHGRRQNAKRLRDITRRNRES